MPPLKKPKPKKPKPKKPKKPGGPAKVKKAPLQGKPDPDKPSKKKPGKKPQKPIKPHPLPGSGFIPAECKTLKGSPSLLDCWLEHYPKIAEAIIWEVPPGMPTVPLVAWPDWSATMKAQLRQAWVDANAWYANGMTGFTGTFVEDPPLNQDFAEEDGPFRTVFDGPSQAWPLFLAQVAHCLAVEIGGWVPWTLRDCEPEALKELLSAFEMLKYDQDDGGPWDCDYPGGYVLGGWSNHEWVTPSHATFTFSFLKQNNLIAPTALGTIGLMLDWCRWNLSHYLGAFGPQNAEYHWQYRGDPPVRRILEGTLLLDPQYAPSHPTPQHWTAGCWGTSAFLRSLLRAVNIPVLPIVSGCGHYVPYFMAHGRYLSHADDPYNALAKANYPADILLLDEATFKSWFPYDPNDPQNQNNYETGCKNVGRRVVDLAVWHFSDQLLFYYCSDKFNGLSHASGQVFAIFEKYGYTVADLEATNLWERLEAEAQLKGKC
jgi:hypothetical protein